MQRQQLENDLPQEEQHFDWQALFENAAVTSAAFSATGLVSGAPLNTPLYGAITGLAASRAYGSLFQANHNRGERDAGRLLGMGSANTLFAVLAYAYKIDPMAALFVTMVLAASFLALSKLAASEDNRQAPAPQRRPR